jgi:streptogramin lyase
MIDLNLKLSLRTNAPSRAFRKHSRETATMVTKLTTTGTLSSIRAAGAISLAALTLSLAGCGVGGSSTNAATPAPLVRGGITGKVHGGQQPVTGATIQLYTVGTSGAASAATPLLTSAVTTSDGTGVGGNVGNNFNALPAGNFTITGLYSCGSATQVYLVASGGNSGSGTNSAIALMAPLGSCTTLLANAATTFVQINELSTIASVYALAPYMTGYTNLGATGSNPAGLVNAVANFNNLYSLTSGFAPGASLPAGATVPAIEINTLADILASCINTSSASTGPCTTLLTATGATNTVGAALAFAKSPGSSTLTALFSLVSATAPFQPTLSVAPSDWTVAIKYNAGGTLSSPYGIAIDAAGDAWITNAMGASVTELGPSGAVVNTLTGGGLINPKGIAIDRTGNVWVADAAANLVAEFSNAGTLKSGSGYTAGGLNGPVALAMDSHGYAWVANLTGNSVTELNTSGSALQTSLTGSSTISGPSGIALDATGNVYVANSGGGNVVKLTNSTGAVASGSPFTDIGLQGTTAVATDLSGNVWATGSTTGSTLAGAVSQFSSAGTAASYSPVSNGGLSVPVGVATSGGSAWITNGQTAGSLSQLVLGQAAPSSPAAGFGSLNAPVGVAVDLSGDVWTADSGDNTVSVFLGLTSPVTTPLAANVGP